MIAEIDIDTDPLIEMEREEEAPAVSEWDLYLEAIAAEEEEEDPFDGGGDNGDADDHSGQAYSIACVRGEALSRRISV